MGEYSNISAKYSGILGKCSSIFGKYSDILDKSSVIFGQFRDPLSYYCMGGYRDIFFENLFVFWANPVVFWIINWYFGQIWWYFGPIRLLKNFLCLPDRLIYLSRNDQTKRLAWFALLTIFKHIWQHWFIFDNLNQYDNVGRFW